MAPVEARGKLRLDAPTGRSLELVARGDSLRCEVPGLTELRALAPRSFTGRNRSVRSLARMLKSLGLTLSFESNGRTFFQVGRDVKPTLLARLLGLGPARVPISSVLLLFKR